MGEGSVSKTLIPEQGALYQTGSLGLGGLEQNLVWSKLPRRLAPMLGQMLHPPTLPPPALLFPAGPGLSALGFSAVTAPCSHLLLRDEDFWAFRKH